jgi:hypothetical protein
VTSTVINPIHEAPQMSHTLHEPNAHTDLLACRTRCGSHDPTAAAHLHHQLVWRRTLVAGVSCPVGVAIHVLQHQVAINLRSKIRRK